MPVERIRRGAPYTDMRKSLSCDVFVVYGDNISSEEIMMPCSNDNKPEDIAVVLAGKIDEITLIASEVDSDKPYSIAFYAINETLPDEIDIQIRRLDKSEFFETEPSVREISFADGGDLSACKIDFSMFPKKIQKDATLTLKNFDAVSQSKKGESPLFFWYVNLEEAVFKNLTTIFDTTVRSSNSRIKNAEIAGLLEVNNSRVIVESSNLGELQLTQGECVFLNDCSVNNLNLFGESWFDLCVEEEGVDIWDKSPLGRKSSLCCKPASIDAKAMAIRLSFSNLVAYPNSGDERRESNLSVLGNCRNLSFSVPEIRGKPSGVVEVLSHAAIYGCTLSDVTLAMHPSSVAHSLEGKCVMAFCEHAHIESSGDQRLEILGVTPKDFYLSSDSPYKGAAISGVDFDLNQVSLPGLVSLSESAVLNPHVKGLGKRVEKDFKKIGVGVELLHQAVASASTLGSVRTTVAYAAGLSRSKRSECSTERRILRFLSVFGFAQQPLMAFLWWMAVVLYSLLAIIWYEFFSEGDFLEPLATLNCFCELSVEPFNLLKAKPDTSDSAIPWVGYRLTQQRAILALAFGQFVVAFSRYTRVSFRY